MDILRHNNFAMKDIYDRLSPLGLKPKFVRECILPNWWSDELAEIPANRAYAELVLSRQLGIELSSLKDKESDLKTSVNISSRFKHRRNVTSDQLSIAQRLGWRVATAAAMSINRPLKMDAWTASAIRNNILNSGAEYVGLEQLLEFCWDAGIPVVHLRQLPDGKKCMDGMVTWTENRPAIVVSCNRQQAAWHLFILAHELGHIVCGHISPGEVTVDEDVGKKSRKKDEKEANEFAVELLTGLSDKSYIPKLIRVTAQYLAHEAYTIGKRMRIDPGFIVLSYCYNRRTESWALGNAALNKFKSDTDACTQFTCRYEYLDLDELPEDSRHVFECLTEAA